MGFFLSHQPFLDGIFPVFLWFSYGFPMVWGPPFKRLRRGRWTSNFFSQGMLCDENFVAIAEAAVLKDLDSVKKARSFPRVVTGLYGGVNND